MYVRFGGRVLWRQLETEIAMPQGLVDALPILLLIGVGVLVRVSGLVNQKEGLVLTRVVYYVTIPAAIIVSIAGAQLTLAKVWLPVISLVVPCMLAGIMYLTTRRLLHQPELRGVLLVGMVVLAIFAYPFFELFYGPEGLANMAIYDVGNAIYAGPVALTLAQRFGSRRTAPLQRSAAWKRRPPRRCSGQRCLGWQRRCCRSRSGAWWATPCGGQYANSPLAMVSVGLFLRPRRGHLGLVAQFVGLRMVLGGLLGWLMGTVVGPAAST